MIATAEALPTSALPKDIRIVSTPAARWNEVEDDWVALTQRSPYESIFVEANWIGTWIRKYQDSLDIEILRFFHGAELVGACLLTWRVDWKGPIPIRKVFLNAAGEAEWEEVGTEFNHLICLTGSEASTAAALKKHLDQRGWDEFVLAGCCQTAALQALKDTFGAEDLSLQKVPSYYVDLNAIRASGKAFEMSLSYKVRYNIRQSIKIYQESGPIEVERAGTLQRAKEMLAELIELHSQRWGAKGRAGAFASPRFQSFHDELLARCFEQNAVDLVRVSVGGQSIGVLYNFVSGNKAFFYQCGFRITENKRLRPGLVTLQSVLQFYTQSPLAEYDLMAGALEYKRSLSDEYRELEWCSIRRRSWRNMAVDQLKRVYQRVRGSSGAPEKIEALPPEVGSSSAEKDQ